VGISQLDVSRARKLAIQLFHHSAQLLVHHRSETDQIAPVGWTKRDQVFVGRLQMRVQTSVRLSQALGYLSTFEIRFEI
jgi:hypothetical protein